MTVTAETGVTTITEEFLPAGIQARNIIADDATAAKYDLDMFHVDPANNIGRPGTDAYNDAKFQETKESIRQLGVLQPVLFSTNGGDALDLRIGFRRFEIMRQLRAENPDDPRFLAIPAIPLDGSATALEMLRANLAENVHRQDLSAIGKAKIAAQLQASGMTLQAVATEMGFEVARPSEQAADVVDITGRLAAARTRGGIGRRSGV